MHSNYGFQSKRKSTFTKERHAQYRLEQEERRLVKDRKWAKARKRNNGQKVLVK